MSDGGPDPAGGLVERMRSVLQGSVRFELDRAQLTLVARDGSGIVLTADDGGQERT